MSDFKLGDNLPCFRYIISNIKDTNSQTPVTFAIAYLQYLEKCGITDVESINKYFQKITLMAQFNQVNRSTPLNLLKIKNTTYKLDSEESLCTYRKELFKACREPKSFSALYKTVDARYYSCKFCPMSEHYTLAEQDKEYALAKYSLMDLRHFNMIITSMDEIDKLFISYNELYKILNNILKPCSFPGLKILFSTIYTKTDAYFNALLQIKDYSYIQKDFLKELRTFNIKSGTNNICPDYDTLIYNFILEKIDNAPTLSDNEAMAYKHELINREKYSPIFDADAIPAIKKDGDGKKKVVKKGKKVLDVYDVKSSLSASVDNEMLAPDTPVKEYPVSGAIETDPTANVPIPSDEEFKNIPAEKFETASVDILSSEGEIVLEHSLEENIETFGYDDEFDFIDEETFCEDEFIDELSDNFITESSSDNIEKSNEHPELSPVMLDVGKTSNVKDLNDIVQGEDITENEDTQSLGNAALFNNKAEISEYGNQKNDCTSILNENSNNVAPSVESVSTVADTCSEDSPALPVENTPLNYPLNTFLEPYHLNKAELDYIDDIIDESLIDRFISYSLVEEFCIMEPVYFDDTKEDFVLIYSKNSICKVSLSYNYISKFLRNHHYKVGSSRSLALYALFAKYTIRLHRIDAIIPLDKLVYQEKNTFLHKPVLEQLKYSSVVFRNTFMTGGSFNSSSEQLENILIYSAYGNSLHRDRFLSVANSSRYFLEYNEDMELIPTPFTYKSEVPKLSGTIYEFTYTSATDDKEISVYHQLTKELILRLSEKACFNKFNLSILYFSPQNIILFADDYCSDYIYNVVLMHLFKEGVKLNIYPLNVSLKRIRLISEIKK